MNLKDEIIKLKEELDVTLVAHFYQRDEVFELADITGDSLELAKKAMETSSKYIVFCGVGFMGESVKVMSPEKRVLMPKIACCAMARMIDVDYFDESLAKLNAMGVSTEELLPITYINSSAAVKARVGEMGGMVCTSSNAYKIIEKGLKSGKKIFFVPDRCLGQNFAKAFDVKFTSKEGKQEYVWATSWGVSTRLIGGLIMTHSDDFGLVLPPKLAPIQVVIVPIYKGEEQLEAISEKVNVFVKEFRKRGISVKFDNRDTFRPGAKFAEYELKGVPVRIAFGARDLENNTVEVARRDTLEKQTVSQDEVVDFIDDLLNQIQEYLFDRAIDYRKSHTTEVETFDAFKDAIENKGGFVLAHWDGTEETEDKIKEITKATIRCIPNDAKSEAGVCVFTGNPSTKKVLFAKAY